MKRTASRFLLLVALAMASAVPASAIVIRHDRDDADYRALAADYPCVGQIPPFGEGTLIAPRWVLTAAHVAQGLAIGRSVVLLGDEEYVVGKVFLHPAWKGGESDIALVKLDRPVHGIEPAALYRRRDERGKRIVFVGRGDSGTGETGPRRGDGVLRAATNRVEMVSAHWIIFTFDPPGQGTRLEGISGPGDSGGPALKAGRGGPWILGVSSGGENPPGGRPGTYGSREYYVRVSSYAEWIDEVTGQHAPADSRD